jgi:hypothetical protein
MIGRLAAAGGAIALIALSVFSGLGRQAIFDPAGAVSGYDEQAKQALAHGNYDDAIAKSRAAILQRPMDQSSISTFGAAHFARNGFDQAYRAFSVSALLGWRDPVTERYWIDQSLGQNAYMPAAQWIDAMMRVDGLPGYGQAALAALENTAQGRSAILTRLALRPSWLDAWTRYTPQLDDAAAMDRIASIDRARRAGITVSREAASLASSDLFAQQRFPAALALWTAAETAGDITRRGLWDGDFSKVNEQSVSGPFDWRLLQGGSVELDIEDGDAGKRLTATSDAPIVERVAVEATILPHGPTRLSWKTDGNGATPSALYPRVRCVTGADIPAIDDGNDGNTRWSEVDIPEGCPAQTITIWFDPSLSGTRSASIGDLRFARNPSAG